MITLRLMLFLAFSLVISSAVHAQGTQCRTDPIGSRSANCASDTFVTDSIAAIPPPPGGTVTEQKNTVGYGLTSSGNCDNTSTNAASPCNAAVTLTSLTNSLLGDVALTNVGTYFDGPSIAQGTTGTFLANGTVTLNDASTAVFRCKLWDGTTVMASAETVILSTQTVGALSLSGLITSPAANIRISCVDTTTTAGKILFNITGNSKDSTVTAVRVQ